MQKLNCWEIKKCGREPGGSKARELGVCPTATDSSSDGINDGRDAGRICWAVAGTFCGEDATGFFARQEVSCMACDVFKRIRDEEGPAFRIMKTGGTLREAAK